MNELISIDDVKSRMVMVRGQASLLDRDVAALYGVETRIVNQAVRNNPELNSFLPIEPKIPIAQSVSNLIQYPLMKAIDKAGSCFLRAVFRRMQELGLNQTSLAQRMKASRPYVTKVLHGDVSITLRTASRFAKALQMDFTPTLTPRPAPSTSTSTSTRDFDSSPSSAL